MKVEHNFVKLYVKTGTFENIFPIPGSKIQAVFSIEAGTSKILPAAHMYHLHIGSFPPGFHGLDNCREKIGQVNQRHSEPTWKLMGILRFPGTHSFQEISGTSP